MSWLTDGEINAVIKVAEVRYLVQGMTPAIVKEVEYGRVSTSGNPHGTLGLAVSMSIDIVLGSGLICAACAINGYYTHTPRGRMRRAEIRSGRRIVS